MGYLCDAALVRNECQCRDRYLGRWGVRVKPGKGKNRAKAGVPGDECPFSFWAFLGYFAFRRNGLPAFTLFICGSADPLQNPSHWGPVLEQRRPVMKTFAKLALGALMVAGATAATTAAITTPAEARVSVGIGIGVPGYYGGYYGPRYDYGCYRYGYYDCAYPYPAYYDPYPYYGGYYGPSVYFGGGWGGGRGWHGGGGGWHGGGGFHGGGGGHGHR
jgi:hypothetical protein